MLNRQWAERSLIVARGTSTTGTSGTAREIPEQIERLTKAAERMKNVSNALVSALTSVLLPRPPVDENESVLGGCCTPMGKQLETITGELVDVADLIDNVTTRLAL